MRLSEVSPITYTDCRRLSRDEELAAFERWKGGDIAARNMLIESVIPWGYSIAKKLGKKYKLDLDECRAIAAEAIVESMDAYDASKGRLTTWVSSPVTWAVLNYATVGMAPVYKPSSQPKSKEAKAVWKSVGRGTSLGVRKVLKTFEPSRHDRPWTEDGATPVQLEEAIESLPMRHRLAIRGRLSGRLDREIGVDFGCSGQRVRQIRLKAIEKLREHLSPQGAVEA